MQARNTSSPSYPRENTWSVSFTSRELIHNVIPGMCTHVWLPSNVRTHYSHSWSRWICWPWMFGNRDLMLFIYFSHTISLFSKWHLDPFIWAVVQVSLVRSSLVVSLVRLPLLHEDMTQTDPPTNDISIEGGCKFTTKLQTNRLFKTFR